MLEELINLQERFEQNLIGKDFTFIGPIDQNLFEPFMRQVNSTAPVVAISRKFRHFLGNKNAVLSALSILPAETPLRIYVVDGDNENVLLHNTIEGYCQLNKLDFK